MANAFQEIAQTLKLRNQSLTITPDTVKSTLFYSALCFSLLCLAACNPKGTKDKPVRVPSETLDKITGTAHFPKMNNRILAEEQKRKRLTEMGLDPNKYDLVDSSTDNDKRLRAELYNGSDWTITDVDIEVEKLKTHETRLFRLQRFENKFENKEGPQHPNVTKIQVYLKPFSTTELIGESGNFTDDISVKEDWSWKIVSARGYRE